MWFLLIGLAAVVISHTAPFPFLLEYVEPRRSLWEGPKGDGAPAIYLTYDDGPNPEATPQLLDVLAREGASATFFVIPEFVTAETAPLVWRAVDEGHGVALHSGTRALMLKAPDDLAALLDRAGRSDRGAERRPAVPAVPPPRRLARQRDGTKASIGPATAWPGGDSRCGTSTGGGRRNPTAWPRGSPSARPTARSW